MKKVAVLLSTFNGEKYIEELISSILNQTYQVFSLFIRDDGSTDNTLEIIKTINDARIHILQSNTNLGSKLSFFELANNVSEFDYYMFCDQDDYWCSTKIEELVKRSDLEDENIPLLVFSDSYVTDEKLVIIKESFVDYQKLPVKVISNWKNLLAQNVVQGCTTCFNEAARKLYINYKTTVFHHDHLLAVLVARYGNIIYINKPLVKYRQHEDNVLGSISYNKNYIFYKIKNIRSFIKQEKKVASYFHYPFFFLMIRKIIISLGRNR